MTGHDDDIIAGKAYDAALMRRLMGYLRPYWPAVLVAFAAIVSASVLQLAQPYLMKLAIDRYIATSDVAGMDRIALLFLGILLASFALEFVQTYVLQRTASGSCSTSGRRSTATSSASTWPTTTATRSAA